MGLWEAVAQPAPDALDGAAAIFRPAAGCAHGYLALYFTDVIGFDWPKPA